MAKLAKKFTSVNISKVLLAMEVGAQQVLSVYDVSLANARESATRNKKLGRGEWKVNQLTACAYRITRTA